MSKQVIVSWIPSPSTDVAYQEIVFYRGQSSQRVYKVPAKASSWSTVAYGPLEEGDEIQVSVRTIDKLGKTDKNPPARKFTIPNEIPESASEISFVVAPYSVDPVVPGGPTGPDGSSGPAGPTGPDRFRS